MMMDCDGPVSFKECAVMNKENVHGNFSFFIVVFGTGGCLSTDKSNPYIPAGLKEQKVLQLKKKKSQTNILSCENILHTRELRCATHHRRSQQIFQHHHHHEVGSITKDHNSTVLWWYLRFAEQRRCLDHVTEIA